MELSQLVSNYFLCNSGRDLFFGTDFYSIYDLCRVSNMIRGKLPHFGAYLS